MRIRFGNASAADQPHVAGQTHEFDVAFAKDPDDGGVIGIAVQVGLRRNIGGFDTRIPRSVQTCCVRPIRNDHGERRVQPVFGNGIDDGLEITAAPGNQNGDPMAHGRSR